MKNLKYILITALIMQIGIVKNASAQTWQIGTNYSVQFSLDQANGIFRGMKGDIVFNEQNPNNAKFNVDIDASSLNTGNALMNKHAKSDEWLDATKYPTIKFVSKKINKSGASYLVTGDLSLHGVTKEIAIPFTFKKDGGSASFIGNFNINRSDFKVGKPGGEVAESIKINFTVPVNKA